MLFRLLILVTPLVAFAGCNSLKNKTDHIALECGLKQESVQQRRYLKLLSSHGASYESVDLDALKIRFENSNGEIQPLPLTPRACVPLPDSMGLLQVVDSRNGESLTRTIDTSSLKRELLSLNLTPKPEVQATLACPADGLFASESLVQPLFINVSDQVAGLDVRLDLFNQDNVFIKTLFRKSKGQTELSLPSSINVQDISEGSYLLKIYGHHISQGIDSRPQLLSSEQLCKLNILRGTVYVGGLDTDAKQLVYPPRTRLPWTIQNPFEKLYVCQEERIFSDAGLAQTSESCKPQNLCAELGNFKEVVQISTENPGVFDYFVFSQNRAGKKSDVKCQTVIVSDTPPTLTVTWAHDDLKKPGSILRKPYAILKADVETQHGLIQASDVGNNLTCKVDFEIKGKNTFSEKGVYCTEGRCKGQSLADFVPCDKHVAFTLVDALNQPTLLNSRLRLTVRTTDGAGHTAESQASLWINQSTWIKDVLPYTIDGKTLSLTTYLLDSSSDVLATFSGDEQAQLATFTSGRWEKLKADDLPATDYKLTRTRDGSIRIARILRYGNEVKVDIFGYKDAQLIPISITPEQNLISYCGRFLFGPDNIGFCLGSSANEAYELVQNRWTKLPAAIEPTHPAAQSSVRWRVLKDGKVAAAMESGIYIWDGKAWTVKTLDFEPQVYGLDLLEDFKGRLWIYIQPGEKSHGLYRVDSERLVLFASPAPLTRLTTNSMLPASSEGATYFAADLQRFDFSTDSWIKDTYPASMFPDIEDRQSVTDDSNRTFVWLGDKGFFESAQELLYWPIKSLGHNPRGGPPSIDAGRNLIYFVDSTSTPNSLVRLRPSSISSFDSNMTGITDLRVTGTWDRTDGQTVLNFSDGNQFILYNDRLERVKGPDVFRDALQVTALSAGRYCVSNLAGLWLYDPIQGLNRKFASDNTLGAHQQCTEDNQGNLWWYNHFEGTLHHFDGQTSKNVDILRTEGEQLRTLKTISNQSKILLATSQRLIALNTNGSLEKSIHLNDITSSQPLADFQSYLSLGDNEIILQANGVSKQKVFFSIDLEAGEIQEEHALAKLVGQYYLSRSIHRKGRAYLLTMSPNAVIVVRDKGEWQKKGNRADYVHVSPDKTSFPSWFTVDNFERAWFLTNRMPYKLGRVDLEFTP